MSNRVTAMKSQKRCKKDPGIIRSAKLPVAVSSAKRKENRKIS